MEAFGFDIRLGRPEQLVSVESYRQAARRKLPKVVWSYVDGGADDQHSLTANRGAFDRWALRAQVLTGHEHHDLTTTVAGVPLSMPVLLGPTGFAGLSNWRGDVAAAWAAGSRGTRYVTSTLSSWSVEEIAAATDTPQFFQLYPSQEDVTADLMRRAWDAGNRALFVTVDVPVKGNREGERRTGMGIPPTMTPGTALNMLRHLPWTYRMLRHQRIAGRNLVAGGGVTAAVESIDIQSRFLAQASLNWDDFAWMREQWKGALYLKGVMTAQDAKHAVALGADGVVVSNHGGRQLDRLPGTLDALPAVVDAIGDTAEVLLDGGIRRGTDVITALCLGADAVLIGRPYLYGLAVAGERGVGNVLDILREEIDRALTLMGVGDLGELDRTWLIDRSATSPSQ